jgi:hypothetical protein
MTTFSLKRDCIIALTVLSFGFACTKRPNEPRAEIAPAQPYQSPVGFTQVEPAPIDSNNSPGQSLDAELCGQFALSDVASLCESLTPGCTEECSVLQAAIGMNPVKIDTQPSQISLFCGQYNFSWYDPEAYASAACFPRPVCHRGNFVRMPALNAGETRWFLELETWWDSGGICQEWPKRGSASFPQKFRQRDGSTVEYINQTAHGGEGFLPLLPVSLEDYFLHP